MNKRILLIEDDMNISRTLTVHLQYFFGAIGFIAIPIGGMLAYCDR